jgi:hypothetical protein
LSTVLNERKWKHFELTEINKFYGTRSFSFTTDIYEKISVVIESFDLEMQPLFEFLHDMYSISIIGDTNLFPDDIQQITRNNPNLVCFENYNNCASIAIDDLYLLVTSCKFLTKLNLTLYDGTNEQIVNTFKNTPNLTTLQINGGRYLDIISLTVIEIITSNMNLQECSFIQCPGLDAEYVNTEVVACSLENGVRYGHCTSIK